jgi:hypothetical protein
LNPSGTNGAGSNPSASPQPPDEAHEADPLRRFRSWRGFLVAVIALNILFVYGMLGGTSDPSVKAWYIALVWLPFNAIATAFYLAFIYKLKGGRGGAAFTFICLGMIAANWLIMLSV